MSERVVPTRRQVPGPATAPSCCPAAARTRPSTTRPPGTYSHRPRRRRLLRRIRRSDTAVL